MKVCSSPFPLPLFLFPNFKTLILRLAIGIRFNVLHNENDIKYCVVEINQ